MAISSESLDVRTLQEAWIAFDRIAHLRPIRSGHEVEASEPKAVLRYLLQSRGLNQGDLASIAAQSNLSAILAGKRKISAALASNLGKFFRISPAVFLPG